MGTQNSENKNTKIIDNESLYTENGMQAFFDGERYV